jgi:hypothetical protein
VVYVDGCEVGLTPQRGLLVQPGLVTISLKPLEPGLEAKVVTRRRRLSAGASLRVNERLR